MKANHVNDTYKDCAHLPNAINIHPDLLHNNVYQQRIDFMSRLKCAIDIIKCGKMMNPTEDNENGFYREFYSTPENLRISKL